MSIIKRLSSLLLRKKAIILYKDSLVEEIENFFMQPLLICALNIKK